MKKTFIAIVFLSVFVPAISLADVIIIGHPGLKIDSITAKQVKKLYLGKTKTIDGLEIKLADLKPLQKEFLSKFIGKSAKAYKKNWMKKVFAEGVTAPTLFKKSSEVLDYVRSTANTIGYVSSEDGTVKVLLK